MNWDNSRILSQPLRLFWRGWESNTFALQRSGWEISAAEDYERQMMGIAFRHKEGGMRGISDYIDYDFFHSRQRSRYDSVDTDEQTPMFGCNMASDLIIHIRHINMAKQNFNPIDARPAYSSDMHLDDFAHFQKIDVNTKEIFLKQASMKDILNMALQKQEPRQEQIRKEMIHRKEMNIMRDSKLKAHLRLVT